MKEKTADEMFEELGYVEKEDYRNYYTNKNYTLYKKIDDPSQESIVFDHTNKTIKKRHIYTEIASETTMPELQAINKKCQELGWLDD